MRVLYQVGGGFSREILDFFWVPRVLGPARSAEPEVGDRNHEGFDATLVALMATEDCSFGVHICISGFYGQTEGDFPDLSHLFSSLGRCFVCKCSTCKGLQIWSRRDLSIK